MKNLRIIFAVIAVVTLIQIVDGFRVIVQIYKLNQEKEKILARMSYISEKISYYRRLLDYYQTPEGLEGLIRKELDYVASGEIMVVKGWRGKKEESGRVEGLRGE